MRVEPEMEIKKKKIVKKIVQKNKTKKDMKMQTEKEMKIKIEKTPKIKIKTKHANRKEIKL
jgi:hypothetical protein